ncbi:MAG: NYN domain-containing protein [Ignavibacteriae bacterium]|nr:NYN domain-containing protein [Ignavibacteria bacterium]MBI3363361.1 NYN domain-containing protein [Ignavibacteriota bacterium]
MNRVVFFVDGFNLYHSINDNPAYHKYKWLDIAKLARAFLTQQDRLEDIFYFTALTTWNSPKMARHKLFIKALELRNVKVVYGEFRSKDRFCSLCKKTYRVHEEKQTDVNIAIHLFRLAIEDRYDTALIISGDSDLLPSIKAVQLAFPTKKIGVIIPFGRRAEELKQVCDRHMKIKLHHLDSSMFPDEIDLGNGQKLHRPVTWR